MASLTALCDAIIFTGEAFVEGHALLIAKDKIHDIIARSKITPDVRTVSYKDKILAPGFIDAQVNGGGNILFNNTPTPEACLAIAKAHRRFGTTRLLPTVITDRPETTQKALAAMRLARGKDKSILGIHIEGPHLSVERRGVHKAEYVRALGTADLKFYKRGGDEIMLMTVAPENAAPAQIKELRAQGVIVSLGHTQAAPEQIRAALAAGATGFTHLFNGMGGLSARGHGPADVALDDRDSWCSVIADGHHVNPEMIRLALRAKPPGKLFLVSDAMAPSASEQPQVFKLYGEDIRVEGGRCVNLEGKLAGASITVAEAVRYCIEKVALEPGEALRMASSYPAAFLGVDDRLGKLLPGYTADAVVLDTKFKPEVVWVAGELSA